MKAYIAPIVRQCGSPVEGRNVLREYLQVRILGCMQRKAAMVPLAFHGGTALRFLFSSRRYSEDLDFALEGNANLYDFRGYLREIQSIFSAEAYRVEIKLNDKKTVHSAFVRYQGLLYELDLSPHRNEVLSVKIEIDTHPPKGAGLTTSLVRRHETLQIHHHDRSSLLGGKLHAILQRPYTKGRDVYDLFWYLSDPSWPPPNLVLLNNALRQTGWKKGRITEKNWRHVVRDQLQTVEWKQVADDVRPFLETTGEEELLTSENLERVLG